MDSEEKEFRRGQIADFRYSVVAELCNPYLTPEKRKVLIKEKTCRQYQIPFSKKTTITGDTIRNWIDRYRRNGKEGLLPKVRNDYGRARSFNDLEASSLVELLEKKPQLTASAALAKLQREGVITTRISSSSLSRFIQANNLKRKDRLKKKDEKVQKRFGFEYPLECVQADAMHGFAIPDGKGKKRKAILLAFIDDATRRIVYGQFDFNEKSILFEIGIRHIIKAHGKIGMLYTDNGATFVSSESKRIVESMGIYLCHSEPYKPQGRGKVERFFRTVRQSFLDPLEADSIGSLDQLNQLFRTWLEMEYHRKIHSSLGITPIDAWLAKSERIRRIDPLIDIDRAFYHRSTRRVYEDSIISLNGVAFEVPSILIGKKVDIRFDPTRKIDWLLVFHDGKDYGEARVADVYANAKVKRNHDFSGEIECSTPVDSHKGVLL